MELEVKVSLIRMRIERFKKKFEKELSEETEKDKALFVFDKDHLYDVWEKENNYNGPRAWGKFFGLRKLEEDRRPVSESESTGEEAVAVAEIEEENSSITNKFQAPNTVAKTKSEPTENPEG